jgi:TM2 domain-containing membrane protein YozV
MPRNASFNPVFTFFFINVYGSVVEVLASLAKVFSSILFVLSPVFYMTRSPRRDAGSTAVVHMTMHSQHLSA